jgi:hypothetical protein
MLWFSVAVMLGLAMLAWRNAHQLKLQGDTSRLRTAFVFVARQRYNLRTILATTGALENVRDRRHASCSADGIHLRCAAEVAWFLSNGGR